MHNLSKMNWEHVLMGKHSREKPGFYSELLTRLTQKVLPPYYPEDDVMRLHTRLSLRIFLQGLEAAYQDDPDLVVSIKQAANKTYTHLATVVNGDILSDPLHRRLERLDWSGEGIPRLATEVQEGLGEPPSELTQLREAARRIRASFSEMGTCVDLSYRTEKLAEDLALLQTLHAIAETNDPSKQHALLIGILVELPHERSLLSYVDKKSRLVVEQIVQQSADSGERYIAQTKRQHVEYFNSALIGGLLVAIFAACKIWLDSLAIPRLTQGVVLGLNYSACFVLCNLVGGTIATKQPSMTAATFARVIDGPKSVLRLFRQLLASQGVALMGNLLAAAALTFAIGAVFSFGTDVEASMFKKNRLGFSVVWYAAIAGVFLSLAGILSGYFANLMVYHQFGSRLENRFGWRPSKRMRKLAPKIVGSTVLGMLLGISGPLGELTGLPIDIRHIAFSSAQATIAATADNVLWLLAGLVVIASTNLLVSFGCTFLISRYGRRLL